MTKFVLLAFVLSSSLSLPAQLNKQKVREEVEFLLKKYSNYYVDTLRGMSPQQWNERVNRLWSKVNAAKDMEEYWYALRYFGSLINDQHTEFPDGGLYNRNGIFWKTDTIFPVWIKTWTDGRVFAVKDYHYCIPKKAEILSINGYSAKDLSLAMRELNFAEDRYALAFGNDQEEGDVRTWTNFTNFLHCEKIKSPYQILYMEYGDDSCKEIVLQGIPRGEIYSAYKKSGDKKKVRKKLAFSKTPVEYTKLNDSIAVLDINLFWGKNPLSLLFSNNDSRFNKLMKRHMKSLAKDSVKHLIIDIRGNPGGYMGSVYKTMDYLTDSIYGLNDVYKVSEESKRMAPRVLKNTYSIVYGKAEKEKIKASLDIFSKMPNGALFPVDTLLNMRHTPEKLRHKYRGKVYVLTDALTYSAGIIFCNLVKETNMGLLVGESPGGYSSVTGGPRVRIIPPYNKFFRMDVSYSQRKPSGDGSDYTYLEPDCLIETTFEEWLNDEDLKLEKLVKKIQTGDLCAARLNPVSK
jgi:hypothetical protein